METTVQYLQRRKRELSEEIERLRAELVIVGRALDAVETPEKPSREAEPSPELVAEKPKRSGPGYYKRPTLRERMQGDISKLALKPLALRALSERFPEGTTTQRLREFLVKEWNRADVGVASLQVMLSQLKQVGEIDFRNQLWVFIAKEDDPL